MPQYLSTCASSTTTTGTGFTAVDAGSATLLAATTTLVVAHTLGVVPDVVVLEETNGTGVSTESSVTAKTATDFTITVDIAPTTEDAIFDWLAIKI